MGVKGLKLVLVRSVCEQKQSQTQNVLRTSEDWQQTRVDVILRQEFFVIKILSLVCGKQSVVFASMLLVERLENRSSVLIGQFGSIGTVK